MARSLARFARSLACGAALLLGAAATRATAQGIANGGFEDGTLAPWYNSQALCTNDVPGCVGWSATTAEAHSGRWSALGLGNWQMRQNFAPVPVPSVQSLTVWMREPDNARFATVGTGVFAFFYADGSLSETLLHWDTPAEWTRLNLGSALDPSKSLTGLGIWGEDVLSPEVLAATFYVDDVSLTTTAPEPATLPLVAGGLLALGAGTRRRRS